MNRKHFEGDNPNNAQSDKHYTAQFLIYILKSLIWIYFIIIVWLNITALWYLQPASVCWVSEWTNLRRENSFTVHCPIISNQRRPPFFSY